MRVQLGLTIGVSAVIDVIIYLTFYVIILISVFSISTHFTEKAKLKMEIQKRDVTIEALLISCEMGHLIKIMRPKDESQPPYKKGTSQAGDNASQ
jgi:hypothetical protein